MRRYNKIVYIKERNYSKDSLGDNVRSGTTQIAKAYAEVKPIKGERREKYDQVTRGDVVEIKTRAPKTWQMKDEYLIEHNGKDYQINRWMLDERNWELTIEAYVKS